MGAMRVGDARWKTRDKLDQYRGILRLYARERKLEQRTAVKRVNQISRRLNALRLDVGQYRAIVKGVLEGKNATTQQLLSRHNGKELRLKNLRSKAEDVYARLREESHLRHRRLDELRHEKKKSVKRCFDLQLERAVLTREYEAQTRGIARDVVRQRLITRYQGSTAKQSAAKAIRSTYLLMLDVLRKDAVYRDRLLSALKRDRVDQSGAILRTTIMGQLTAERFDDVAERYRRMTQNVWRNMKTRDRTLNVVRSRVEDLWMYARSLIRTESDTAVLVKRETGRGPSADTVALERQINRLETILDRVKDPLLVRSYGDLLSRLEEQARQKSRLIAQFEHSVADRDSLLIEKNRALSTLSDLRHWLVAITERFRTDEIALLGQIEVQKRREDDRKRLRKDRGNLLMNVRAALQSMISMLACVKKGAKGPVKRVPARETGGKTTRVVEKTEESEDHSQKFEAPPMEELETEGLSLLSNVSRKVGALFGMSNFDLETEREDRARDLYRSYVSNYRSKLKFGSVEFFESTGFLVEHEAVDSSIPTRADVKLRSKQTVEAHLKYD